MFSSTVFFIFLFTYLGIIYGYDSYLNNQSRKLNDAIQAFGQQVPAADQVNIISFYSQIVNLKSILKNHVYFSPFLLWLEKNTEANVFWSAMQADTARSSVTFMGIARTIGDFNQQAAIFASRPEVVKEEATNVALVNGLWQFNLKIYFNQSFFQEPPTQSP